MDASARAPYAASALLLFGAVTAASLLAVLDTLGVQRAPDDLVPPARTVFYSATTHQDHRVLLQVVALAGDVRRHLDLAGQLDARHLPKRRVRLLRSRGVHASAHATALRAALEVRGLDLGDLVAAPLADQLLNGWHLPASYVLFDSRWFKSLYCSYALSQSPAAGCVACAR